MDWLSAAKRRGAILLEDCHAKSRRLQDEGTTLAENQRYWEAIKYWDEAIELTPGSAILHEMKSQVSVVVVVVIVVVILFPVGVFDNARLCWSWVSCFQQWNAQRGQCNCIPPGQWLGRHWLTHRQE